MTQFVRKLSSLVVALAFVLASPMNALAASATFTLTSPVTIHNQVYSTVLSGSVASGGSLFMAVVSVKHPSQANLVPKFYLGGVAKTLTALPNGPDGELMWYYPATNPPSLSGRLDLKSTSGGDITITPGPGQFVKLMLASCSSYPTLTGC